ncbi:P-loop containing nucleoside triphosphate hydrolase protein [Aspergillus cavernicola]|uniref:P-loop containing nucleoside triphosphate hydrolase protein n=1 Tax=Aspergillus cavernicola TaxID=176166 RepID=A0ABR4IIL6_9EURO
MALYWKSYLHNLVRTPLFNFTTRKHVPTLVTGILCTFIASFTVPLFSVLLGQIFNEFTLFGGGDITGPVLIQKVSSYCIQLVALGVLAWFWNGIYFVFFVVFGELQAANARSRLFEGLLKKDQQFFEGQEEGPRTFLGCLQMQVHELQTATSQSLGMVLQYFFRALVALGLAFYTSWNLSLVILAGIPIVSLIVPFLAPKINATIEAQQKELKAASKVVNSAVTYIDTVKCFNAQGVELDKFSREVDKAAAHYHRQATLNALQTSAVRFMMFGMFVQGFWYGGTLVLSGSLSAGDVLRTFWACSTAAQSIDSLMPHLVILEKGKVAASALQTTLYGGEESLTVKQMVGGHYPTHCEGDILVKKLSFSYPSQPDRLSLDSASFSFPAGETTFVIGKSGSGKSTLGQVLTRFYLPTSGEVFIDGNPIETLGINWIRNNVTYVEQRSILFNESIFKNIAFGGNNHEDIRKEDVEESIALAMLVSTIEKLPKGIDTFVGEGGNALSGGQKQRVAIARARLRDSPILILDEPTSALDVANRIQVMNAIRRWREGKTTIIITHDMSHIKDSDFVYVLDQGSVVQVGYKGEIKDNPKFGGFFHEDHSIKTTHQYQYDDVGKDPFDDGLSDTSSMCSNDSFYDRPPPPPPKDLYVKSSYANARGNFPTSSQRRSDQLDRVDTSLRKDPFVVHTETSMDDVGSMRTKKFRFQGSSSNTFKLRRLKKFRRRQRKSLVINKKGTLPESPQRPIRRAMRSVLPTLSPKQRLYLFIAALCTLAHSSATPIFSYLLSRLLQTFYNGNSDSMRWALAVLGVAICDAFINYLMYYLLDLCGQAWVDRLRKTAFQRVLDQARKWFEDENNSASQLSTCLHEGGEEVRNIVTRFSHYVLIAASVTLMAVIWSLAMSWKLTFVALSCGPVIYAITRGFETTSGIWDRRCAAARSATSEVFLETFAEIRTVRSLTLEPYFHRKYLKAVSGGLTVGLRKAIYTGLLFGLVECTILFVSSLIFYYGAALVRHGEFTVEDVMSVFSVLLFSIAYASTVMTWIPQISNSREMARKLFRLVDLPEHVSHEHSGNLRIPKVAPVRLERLNFRYPSRPDAPVLRNVSINIPDGSCTAIVGRSGSGKSTIASLLLSLYEPLSSSLPSISLGGIDIRKLHTPSLRSLVSIVSQQPTIFPYTIQENINYGLEHDSVLSTLYNVRTAARAAGIDDFISSLPGGYQTVIGEGGVGLSGGQAQRVAIARALVRQPQILVLDEATSSLDPNCAVVIKQTVHRLVAARAGLTVIIITHAKEMIEIADNIVVLEEGRVVEEGPYRALSRRAGGKLWELIEQPTTNNHHHHHQSQLVR